MPVSPSGLDHLYGYRCIDTLGNLACASGGELVYFSALLAVSEKPPSIYGGDSDAGSRQSIYTGHSCPITCIAVHHDQGYAASAECGAFPTVHIWPTNAHALKNEGALRTLQTPIQSGGVSCMCFMGLSALIVVGADEHSTILVYDWKKPLLMARMPGEPERLAPILCVAPGGSGGAGGVEFVTCGMRHMTFWTLKGGIQLNGRRGRFGACPGVWQTFTSLCMVRATLKGTNEPSQVTLCGAEDGSIYAWSESAKLVSVFPDAHKGGVASLVSFSDRPVLASAGADGVIRTWMVVGGEDTIQPASHVSLPPSTTKGAHPDRVFALAIVPGEGVAEPRVAAGSTCGTIFLAAVDGENGSLSNPLPALGGHKGGDSARLVGVCSGGADRGLVVSAGVDGCFRVWDLDKRKMAQMFQAEGGIVCFDWCGPEGPLADHLAACLQNGRVQAFSVSATSYSIKSAFALKGGVLGTCARYTKEGKQLAIGREDGKIDVFNGPSYSLVATLKGGHEGSVGQLDWELGGGTMRSNSYMDPKEIAYWTVTTGKHARIRDPSLCRDTHWSDERCRIAWSHKGLLEEITVALRERKDQRPAGQVTCTVASRGDAVTRDTPGLVACGDATGGVFLFRYPSIHGNELGWPGRAHDGGIANVCFGGGGRVLVSAGASDACIVQWRLVREGEGGRGGFAQASAAEEVGEEVQGQQDGTRMDSMKEGDNQLIEEGEHEVTLLKEKIARREWEDSLEHLQRAFSRFKQTPVGEEWRWKLLKRCDKMQEGCVQDAAVRLQDCRDLALHGQLNSKGEPAVEKLESARRLYEIAREAARVCGSEGRGPPILKTSHGILAEVEVEITAVTSCLSKAEQFLASAEDCRKACNNQLATAGRLCLTLTGGDSQPMSNEEAEKELAVLLKKVSSSLTYFDENVARAKEQYKEQWVAGRAGRQTCERMDETISRIMRRQMEALELEIRCLELEADFDERHHPYISTEKKKEGLRTAEIIRDEASACIGSSDLEMDVGRRIYEILARLEGGLAADRKKQEELEVLQMKVRDLEVNVEVGSPHVDRKKDEASSLLRSMEDQSSKLSDTDRAKLSSLRKRVATAESQVLSSGFSTPRGSDSFSLLSSPARRLHEGASKGGMVHQSATNRSMQRGSSSLSSSVDASEMASRTGAAVLPATPEHGRVRVPPPRWGDDVQGEGDTSLTEEDEVVHNYDDNVSEGVEGEEDDRDVMSDREGGAGGDDAPGSEGGVGGGGGGGLLDESVEGDTGIEVQPGRKNVKPPEDGEDSGQSMDEEEEVADE